VLESLTGNSALFLGALVVLLICLWPALAAQRKAIAKVDSSMEMQRAGLELQRETNRLLAELLKAVQR
jgi:hypothetical protein